MGYTLTMPPQCLNLNEYGAENAVAAPQARNFAFFDHKSANISLFFFYFLLTRRLVRFPFGLFLGGGGGLMIVSECLGGMAPWPPLGPPMGV